MARPLWKTKIAEWLSRVACRMKVGSRVQVPDTPATLLHLLAMIREHDSGPFAILCADEHQAADLDTGLREWSAALDIPLLLRHVPYVGGARREWIPENEASRSATLAELLAGTSAAYILCPNTLFSQAPRPGCFRTQSFTLKIGDESWPPERLAEKLVELDYDDELEVRVPGEFSRRGGILDVFSPVHPDPCRIEFFGNTIDTLRFFDAESQRSFDKTDSFHVIPRGQIALESESESTVHDYFPAETPVVIVQPEAVLEHLERFDETKLIEQLHDFREARHNNILTLEQTGNGPSTCIGLEESILPFHPELGAEALTLHYQNLRNGIRRWQQTGVDIVACCGSAGETERFQQVLATELRCPDLPVFIAPERIPGGVLFNDMNLAVLSETELFGKNPSVRHRRSVHYNADYTLGGEMPLEDGCFAVHAAHGVCQYKGMTEIDSNGVLQEVLELEFADDAVMFVPLDQSHLLSRYVGGGKKRPRLSTLGGRAWKRAKESAAAAVYDLAAELLRIEALRKRSTGAAHSPDPHWENAFASAFPYQETPDQQTAIDEVLAELERPDAMNRLLCGDVGYGKTEVAMRAAFRAILNKKQVAILVPTTLLAQQHFNTFSERMAEYPVTIELLCRFRTDAEQKKILRQLAEGKIDIVIGTHRLIQDDVLFNDLGLLVIDEEQRFGVRHKEKLKRMRATVNILTMTATPIPRTLYFSLSGLRNLSTIMTPPAERLPVTTVVAQYDEDLVRQAILREVERSGQVFFLHNRVKTIDGMAYSLSQKVPEARYAVAHGQMPPHQLETVMNDYVAGKIDVLVCTTIIESGLDIPNANTIIIDHANRFGLAELYQLRGRVGRYHNQAYAYLLLPPMGILPSNARERLSAIRQYTHLGAGIKLALRDLEIRGAGNILGSEQSGHISAVGFQLYCKLLDQAVTRLENRTEHSPSDTTLTADVIVFGHCTEHPERSALIPRNYIPAESLRLQYYRRFSQVQTAKEADEILAELADRFGPLPDEVKLYAATIKVRITAAEKNVHSVALRNGKIMLETEKGLVRKSDGAIPEVVSPNASTLECCQDILAVLRSSP
jgi:transcription-repair coupling factor (superfamily II helicase)